MNRGEQRERAVYGLSVDGALFSYVGATTQNTKTRLWEHRSRARKGHPAPVYEWMRSVGIDRVAITKINVVPAEQDLARAEADAISWFIRLGHPLVNEIGRDGTPDSHSPSSKRRIGDSNKGRATWTKGKRGLAAGWSDERRAAQATRISEYNRSRRVA